MLRIKVFTINRIGGQIFNRKTSNILACFIPQLSPRQTFYSDSRPSFA
jgi:hypothetical protein